MVEDFTSPEIEGLSGSVCCLIEEKQLFLREDGSVWFGAFFYFRVCSVCRLRLEKVQKGWKRFGALFAAN
jgi:hypothetical protein